MTSTKRCPGVDFTVDLKRLAASVAVAAENANLPKKRARALAAATVASYRERMFALAGLSPLEIWHSQINLEQELKVIREPRAEAQPHDNHRQSAAKRSREGRQLPTPRNR